MNYIYLLLFLSSPISWGKEQLPVCPANTSLVDLKTLYAGERIVFCQIKYKGNLVKHGEEYRFSKSGKIIKKNYYYGKEVYKFPIRNKNNNKSKEIEDKLEIIFHRFFTLWNIHPGKKIPISNLNNDGCRHNPLKRLNFLLKNISYTQNIRFRRRCYFQGKLYLSMDKELTSVFKVKDIFDYETLKLRYKLTKTTQGKDFLLTINVLGAKLIGKKSNIKLDALAILEFSPNKMFITKGKQGVLIQSGKFNVTQVDGKSYSFQKEL